MASSSPDTHTRALPTAWTAQDSLDSIAEALDAIETYKKKDVSKGKVGLEAPSILNSTSGSRRTIQGRRQCTDNATELLQDHCIQQISSRDSIPTERARLEDWRSTGMHPGCFETVPNTRFPNASLSPAVHLH